MSLCGLLDSLGHIICHPETSSLCEKIGKPPGSSLLKKLFFYIFIYLAVLGLSCIMQDLPSLL